MIPSLTPRFALLVFVLVASTLRAEFPVTEERPLAPLLGRSHDAHVVATDAGFLALWTTDTTYGERGLARVGRFSPDGVLEGQAIAWELPPSFQWLDAASNGDEVLVAGRCDSTGQSCLARFAAAGDLLGLTPLPLRRATAARVASNGDGFLVLLAMAAPREVLAIPVDAGGGVGETTLVHTWGGAPEALSVTTAAGAYFATFGFGTERLLVRLSPDGIEKAARLDLPGATTFTIRAEGSADRILVVASALSPLYAVFDSDLRILTSWTALDSARPPVALAPSSSGWIVAGSSSSGRAMRPIAADGSVGEARRVAGADDLAGRSDRVASVWTTLQFVPARFPNDARMEIVSDDGFPLVDAMTISLGPAPQIHPAAAQAGGVTMTTWSERAPDGAFVVRIRPFDASGTPLAPAVSMPFRGPTQTRPSIAAGAGSFFVVWSEGAGGIGGVSGARVSSRGELLDAEPIPLFGTAEWEGTDRTADVGWSGGEWLVVSTDAKGSIAGRRVSPAGMLTGAPLGIAPVGQRPVLSCNGSECLVAWQGPPLPDDVCRITCPPPPPTVRATRISPTLAFLDREPTLLTGPWESGEAGAAWNELADAWLVWWSNDGEQRISRSGAPLPRDREHRPLPGSRSAIAEREGWRVAWSIDASGDLFHAWSATGAIPGIDSHFVLTRSPERESDVRLVDAPRPMALFTRESQVEAGSPRVHARFLDEAAEPQPAEIKARAERAGGLVRIAWESTNDLLLFGVEELIGDYWIGAAYLYESARSVLLTDIRGTKFRVVAFTAGGIRVVSNEVGVPTARKRVATR